MNELVSSGRLVFDLHDEDGRVATAVLIDRISNTSNDAGLEILGIRKPGDAPPAIKKFIELAKDAAPVGRSGFQFSASDDSPIDLKVIEELGLKYHYSFFDMENQQVTALAIPAENKIFAPTKNDAENVYEVLCISFSANPDTSIPEASVWKAGFLKNRNSRIFLWRENGKAVGFIHFILPEPGGSVDIRSIGTLPGARGAGIGRNLLQHALNKSVEMGFTQAHLTVAVVNERALGLYQRSGFKVVQRYKCYRAEFRT
ncbi:MAG: GNAT family N-acetyltransferase [Bdellovibrionales bacterium]